MKYVNKTYLGEDGLIHHEYQGDQTAETVREDMKRMGELIDNLHKQNKPAYLLLDLSKVTKQDSGARKEATNALNNLKYDKIALFGMSIFLKSVANFVVMAVGKFPKVKFFNSKEEAVKWLTL